jgi:signal transduction histidine kinase
VLVIDDEHGPRESLRMMLKGRYDVLLAGTADEGLALLRQHRPDLVFTDIRMPGKSGIQGLEELRAADPAVAVVMVTGFGDLDTARQAMQRGADDYLRKPCDVEEIRRVAEANIRRTDERRAQAGAQTELARLADSLREQLAQHSRMAALGVASSSMVHDLRNPLAVVTGYVDLLRAELEEAEVSGKPPADARAYLDPIVESLRACIRISEDWRALGNRNALQLEPMPLAPFVRETLARLCGPDAKVRPSFDATPDAAGAVIEADRAHLGRALQNVVENALQAVDERGGRVAVTLCAAPDGRVDLCVTDNGPGMTPEVRDRIFDAFFTTKRGRQGSGLGLFITRTVTEDHGGAVRVETAPGRGTAFHLLLPRTG